MGWFCQLWPSPILATLVLSWWSSSASWLSLPVELGRAWPAPVSSPMMYTGATSNPRHVHHSICWSASQSRCVNTVTFAAYAAVHLQCGQRLVKLPFKLLRFTCTIGLELPPKAFFLATLTELHSVIIIISITTGVPGDCLPGTY